jgi:D-alanyl-D-alanine endopeptidase (penicillin-binding protein 7)
LRVHQRNSWVTVLRTKSGRFGVLSGLVLVQCLGILAVANALAGSEPEPSPYAAVAPLQPFLNPKQLYLHSSAAVVLDGTEGTVLFNKNMDTPRPIASLAKLMTAMVTIDACLPENEPVTISDADRDRLRNSKSRLRAGMLLTRLDLLKFSLAASDNRAAAALARTFPGGAEAFLTAMNAKAQELGLAHTVFEDAAGLRSGNVSTAADLARMVEAASRYPLISEFTTTPNGSVTDLRTGRELRFVNTNRLVRGNRWEIALSKTGYIADAGHCLVMLANIGTRPIVMVLLGSWGELSRFGDANRIKQWLAAAEKKAQTAAHTIAQTAR